MPSITVNLSWVDTNRVEDGYKVYKSTSPMDPETSMPSPIATLDPNSETFVDTDVVYGQTYYYIVSSFNNLQANEVYSVNKEVVCEENIYAIAYDGETHKIDTNGNRLFVDKTTNLFGSVNPSFNMDMDFKGNFYYVSGNTIKKVDKNFQDVWTYDFSPYSIYSNYLAFYVGVDECVYVINTRHENSTGNAKIFKINKDGTEGEIIDEFNPPSSYSYVSITMSPDFSILVVEYLYSTTTYTKIYDMLTTKTYSYNKSNYENQSHTPQRAIAIDKNNNMYSGGRDGMVSYDKYGDERFHLESTFYDYSYGSVLSMDDSHVYTVMRNRDTIYRIDTTNGNVINSTGYTDISDLCIDSNDNIYFASDQSNVGRIRKHAADLSNIWTYNTLSTGFDFILIEPGMHFQSIHKSLGDE